MEWESLNPGVSLTLDSVRARCWEGTPGNSFSSIPANNKFGWESYSIPGGGFGQPLIGFTGTIDISSGNPYTCEWEIKATRNDNGNTVTFDDEGSPEAMKPSELNSVGTVNGLDLSSLCSSGCSGNQIQLQSRPGDNGEMEQLSSASFPSSP